LTSISVIYYLLKEMSNVHTFHPSIKRERFESARQKQSTALNVLDHVYSSVVHHDSPGDVFPGDPVYTATSDLEILTGWAPAMAAILVSVALAGSAGVAKLMRRFLIWRVDIQWYLIGAYLMVLIILGGIGLHIALGGQMPFIPASGAPAWDIALTFLIFVLLGFLINTEEVAWSGFALPQLQAHHGALLAALLITVPEVLLHVPLFWVQDSFIETVGLGWFSAFSVAAVLIYVYVFNMTKGSLLIVTLLHASQNAWSNLLSGNSARPFYLQLY
jgi:uncharacterized protein